MGVGPTGRQGYVHVYIHPSTHTPDWSVHSSINTHIYTHFFTHAPTGPPVHTHACTRACPHIYTHVYNMSAHKSTCMTIHTHDCSAAVPCSIIKTRVAVPAAEFRSLPSAKRGRRPPCRLPNPAHPRLRRLLTSEPWLHKRARVRVCVRACAPLTTARAHFGSA